jgi:Ca2+-transporting ATPase
MTNANHTHSLTPFIPGALLAGLLILTFMVLREFFLTLIWALIIAYVTWPFYLWLRRQLNNKLSQSAAIMSLFIALVFLLAIYGLADLLKDELQLAYQSLAINFAQQHFQLPESLQKIPWLGNYLQESLDRMANDRAGIAKQIAGWAKQGLGELGAFIGSIGHYVLKMGVVLVTLFFCYRDGEEAVSQLRLGLIHSLGKYLAIYLHAAGVTTRAVVYGLVLAASGQGLMAGIGYAFAGVQAPVLFGIITALFALIPMGATLIWLPIAFLQIITGHFWPGVGLLLWGFLIISTVDNVIRPIVISGASRMPFLVVMFGVLGGLSAFGAVGLFLGPVILSILLAVWKAWLELQQTGRGEQDQA